MTLNYTAVPGVSAAAGYQSVVKLHGSAAADQSFAMSPSLAETTIKPLYISSYCHQQDNY